MKQAVEAAREFLGRYGQVFKVAWSVRDTLDPPRRTEDELAFLPAHLELTDTPVSPTARWTMRLIIAFFCVALLWAVFGQLDIVAVAPGKTVVGSRTKVIQPAETAVVKRILVQDGQIVKRGQLLIELDATGTGADYAKAGDALVNARMAMLRLAAVAEALQAGKPPSMQTDASLPVDRFRTEQQLALSQFEAYQAKRHNLQAAISQRRAEIQTVQSLIGPLAESAKIATSRSQDYAKLVEGRYVGRHDYLLREQERIAAERDLASQRSRLQETTSALKGAQEELLMLTADTLQQTLDGLRQAHEQVQQFAPEVAKTEQRDRLMQLRAPVDGTVQQLAMHTVGGVVTPAQALLAVVPSEEALEVEATVLNKDIGFVRPGQRATVKVESFPYTRYGYLEGTVQSVSHDAAQDEKMGLVFPTRVKLSDPTLMIDGVKVALTPGMNLSIEIKTGRRRVIDYLLSPLHQHGHEALRER
ncbi:HlyD family type I secretion periplasmic adaptor subunit [Xanthomonas hyacinthi]|uniref:Membrane fusion protein (MFP) family protein n=1 Tax=Xanthomonas hyacinthi TaxID=56455 RepID=A0A2S7EP15_9XANT|nr:HlyD family type I secretion periplasmic adaptor subunit [Xanthomonas hyacinthi]KLD78354.1 hemolysin secretion protein D [Xanthomonas hyacinthi DSM 19077]PPU93702.1 HlyD family type I secretion periplasmic adaptor subunit [Xanthomonas hyacinthi]QGY77441.1 HlyD family type I secretion periplasmic adaptor subunit [Xanthomonas hyacinthi]